MWLTFHNTNAKHGTTSTALDIEIGEDLQKYTNMLRHKMPDDYRVSQTRRNLVALRWQSSLKS